MPNGREHPCMQFAASTQDQYRPFNLAEHPNVTIASYPAPRSEAHLRETMNGCRGCPMRAVLMAFFDVVAYSDVILTDKTLQHQVQVRRFCHLHPWSFALRGAQNVCLNLLTIGNPTAV